jgi:hypothetical protein
MVREKRKALPVDTLHQIKIAGSGPFHDPVKFLFEMFEPSGYFAHSAFPGKFAKLSPGFGKGIGANRGTGAPRPTAVSMMILVFLSKQFQGVKRWFPGEGGVVLLKSKKDRLQFL